MDTSDTERTRDDCRLGDDPDGRIGNNRNKSKNVSIVVIINTVTDVCVLLKEKKCHKCSKYDHFSKVCRSVKSVHEVNSGHVSLSDNYLDYSSDSDDDEQSFYVHTVNTLTSQPDQVFVKLSVGRLSNYAEIDCKIDTGSQINCLPNFVFKRLKLNLPLEPQMQP